MSKFLVQGRDAGRAARAALGQPRRRRAGRITYTQWLNDGGTLEADLTVTKLDDERFWVVASDTAHRHVETWMRRHIAGDLHAFVTDVTSGFAQLNVQGPRSRELLQSLTTADLSNEAFPFRTRARDRHRLRAGAVRAHHLPRRARLRAVRPDRAGDCTSTTGWSRPASRLGLRHAGLKALASLRMEKGYRDYGHDIDNTDSVLEAGLGFAVDLTSRRLHRARRGASRRRRPGR